VSHLASVFQQLLVGIRRVSIDHHHISPPEWHTPRWKIPNKSGLDRLDLPCIASLGFPTIQFHIFHQSMQDFVVHVQYFVVHIPAQTIPLTLPVPDTRIEVEHNPLGADPLS